MKNVPQQEVFLQCALSVDCITNCRTADFLVVKKVVFARSTRVLLNFWDDFTAVPLCTKNMVFPKQTCFGKAKTCVKVAHMWHTHQSGVSKLRKVEKSNLIRGTFELVRKKCSFSFSIS